MAQHIGVSDAAYRSLFLASDWMAIWRSAGNVGVGLSNNNNNNNNNNTVGGNATNVASTTSVAASVTSSAAAVSNSASLTATANTSNDATMSSSKLESSYVFCFVACDNDFFVLLKRRCRIGHHAR